MNRFESTTKLLMWLMALLLVTLLPFYAFAAPIDTLQPGEWYEFSGSNMNAVDPCPARNCSYSGIVGQKAVMIAWSGGAYDTKRDQLLVWGGGHADYGGNEVYAFGPLTSATPTWKRLTEPSLVVPPISGPNIDPLSDGTPDSVHTYNGLEYDPVNDRFIAYGGSPFPIGNSTFLFSALDLNALTWKTNWPTSAIGTSLGHALVYDSVSKGFWLKNNSTSQFAFFYPAANGGAGLWTYHGPSYFAAMYATLAVDTKRHQLIALGGTTGLYKVDLNTSIRSIPITSGDAGGIAIEKLQAPGFVYDPQGDRFLAWNGGATVYALDPVTFVWSALANYSGNTVNPGLATPQGTYGRFRYVPSKGGLIVVNSTTTDVFFYKLTNAISSTPSPTVTPTVTPTVSIAATFDTQASLNVGGTVNNAAHAQVRQVGIKDPWCAIVNQALAGDIIIFLPGNYLTTCKITVSGTQTAPITLRSQAADLSDRAVFGYSGDSSNILDVYGSNLQFRWLSFGPTAAGGGINPFKLHGTASNLVIDQNYFNNTDIAVLASVSGGVNQNITVSNNIIKNMQGTGLYFGCQDGIACHSLNILIEGNLIDTTNAAGGVGYGMEIKLNSYATIRNNTIYRTAGPGIMVYGSNRGDPASIIERNYVEGTQNDAGINVGGGPAIVRNNVVVGNNYNGIWAQDYKSRGLQKNIWIVNNTVLNNQSGGISVQHWQAGAGNVMAFNAIAPLTGTTALTPASPAGTVLGNITCKRATGCFDQPVTVPYDLWPKVGGPLIGGAGSGPESWRPTDDFMCQSRGSVAAGGAFQRTGSGRGPLLGGGDPRPPCG